MSSLGNEENSAVIKSMRGGRGGSVSAWTGRTASKTVGQNETLDIKDGIIIGRHPVFSGGQGQTDTSNQTRSTQSSTGEGLAETNGGGLGLSDAEANGTNWTTAQGTNWSEAENSGWSLSLAFKYVTLAKIVRDEQHTGQLKMAIADQFEL